MSLSNLEQCNNFVSPKLDDESFFLCIIAASLSKYLNNGEGSSITKKLYQCITEVVGIVL